MLLSGVEVCPLRTALQRAAQASALEGALQQLQRAGLVSIARAGSWAQAPVQGAWHQQQLRQASEDLQVSHAAEELPEPYYHKIVDHTLDDLLERLEYFVEELDYLDADVEYSQGVLTLRLGDLGTYVINKQTPNRQIWMSSPVSGPVRYDWGFGKWVYHRDGHDLHTRLRHELKQLTGQDLELNPCLSCGKLNTCQGEQCAKGLDEP